ncbi:DDE-type integrase/transposase/recombinase [Rhizophagus irregularis DAOM 181602=DAOM 197198]|nr:DDE-type integrase/transposase/recombinase [Rhizophagus irregularis DAOM 181602=DAOM 197198]
MEEDNYKRIIDNIKKENKYELKEGILYRVKGQNKFRVIRDYEYEGLMYMMHDNELSGHFGIEATLDRIKENYWWKNMKEDVEEYVRTCWNCQMRGKPRGKNELTPIKINEPFEMIGIDIVGPLKETEKGNKYIVVAMDYFTKWPEAAPLKEATAKEVVEFIWRDIICRHGCPKKIISDRGTHFNNKMMEELVERCGINHRLSTPYRPQTNGLVERFNKTLCEGLAKLGEENWDKHIPSVLFAYRTKKQSSTRIKPFYATYGRRAKLPLDKDENKITLTDRIKILIEELPVIRRKIKENVKEAQEKQKQQHDKRGIRKPKFEIGEKVLLYEAWREKQWSGKLQSKWKGPYLIHEEFGNGAYKLKELDGRILKTPQNGEWLKKFYDRRGFTPKIVIKGKEVFDKTRVRFD